MNQQMYANLPGMLAPKAAIATGYKMSLIILPQEGGRKTALNHYKFDRKIGPSLYMKVIQGAVRDHRVGIKF